MGFFCMYDHPGKPSKYQEEYCEKLIDHMASGLSKESFCAKIGVHRDTLYEWEKDHKEFKEAAKIGKEKSLLFWEEMGIVGTTEGNHFNASSWKFNMQNRHGWRDKQDLTTDGEKIDHPILYIPAEVKNEL